MFEIINNTCNGNFKMPSSMHGLKCQIFTLLTLLLISLLLSANAYASCTTTGSNSITLPSFNQDLNALPINSPIGAQVMSAKIRQFNCSGLAAGNAHVYGIYTTGRYVSTIDGRRVYGTNIPGIGYAVGVDGSIFAGGATFSCNYHTPPSWIGEPDGHYANEPYSPNSYFNCSSSLVSGYSATFYLQFYKISHPVSSGTLDLSHQIYSAVYFSPSNGTIYGKLPLITTPSNIINTSCTNTISPNPVNLPTINAGQLPFLNSTAGTANFNINTTCPNTTNLHITFTDKNNTGQTGSILTPDSSSTTKGVGMQLSYNSNIVRYGPDMVSSGNTNQFFLNTFSGQQNFPFAASYIRTGAILPGTLSTTATFTFSYQ